MKIKKGYRVVEIMNDTEILIDYGLEDGSINGEEVIVYAIGESIIDPVDKKEIGTFDCIKSTLEVVYPFAGFSVCKKFGFTGSFFDNLSSAMSPLAKLNLVNKTPVCLDVNTEQLSNRKWETGGTISLNDKVMILSKK